MTHAERMAAFLNVGQAEKTKGWWECDVCYAAVQEAVVIDNKVKFTCPNGHENEQ